MKKRHFLILLGVLTASIILIIGIALLLPQSTFHFRPFEPVVVKKQAGISSDYWAATATPFADTKESDIVSATVNFYGYQLGISDAERAQLLSILKKITVTGKGNDNWKRNDGSGVCTFTLCFPDGSSANVANIDGFFALDYVTYRTDKTVLDELSNFHHKMYAKYKP